MTEVRHLAVALGRALHGDRVTCVLSSGQLEAQVALLRRARDIRLPMLILVESPSDDHGEPSRDDLLLSLAALGHPVLSLPEGEEHFTILREARKLTERSLVPVVLAGRVPSERLRAADEGLPLPAEPFTDLGPDQAPIFGERRSRVPRRLDGDRPTRIGAVPARRELAADRLARRIWTDRPVRELAEALAPALVRSGASDAKRQILTTADRFDAIREALDGLDVEVIGLVRLGPWPASEITEVIRSKEALRVVEESDGPGVSPGPLSGRLLSLRGPAHRSWLEALGGLRGSSAPGASHVDIRAATLPPGRSVLELRAELRDWVTLDDPAPIVALGVATGDSAGPESGPPRRQALDDRLRRDVPDLADLGLVRTLEHGSPLRPPVAPAVRRLARTGDTPLTDLAAFRERQSLPVPRPEPLRTASSTPVEAGFLQLPERVGPPPVWNANACDQSGTCWSVCPDDAFAPWIGPTKPFIELLAADELGTLRPILGKWARALEGALSSQSALPQALPSSLETVVAGLPEARRDAAASAGARAISRSTGLAVSRSPGGLLALPIDPERCTGCSLCVAECPSGALTRVDEGQEGSPSADAEIVDRLRTASSSTGDLPALAEILVDSANRETVIGAGSGGPGDGLRTSLRQTLGVLAHVDREHRGHLLTELVRLREGVAKVIHRHLERTLPDDDLDRLAEGLEGLARRDVDLADLSSRVDRGILAERIDGAQLSRWVAVARGVADLEHALRPDAPSHLLVTAARALTGSEDSLLRAPSIVASPGEAFDIGRGLLEGFGEDARKARDLVDEAAGIAGIPKIDARFLLAARPRVIVVVDELELLESLPPGYLEVASGRLDLTVVVLAQPGPAERGAGGADLALLTVSLGGAVFDQIVPGLPEGLTLAAEDFADGTSGILRVLVTRPSASGLPTDAALEQSRSAVRSRVFPLLRFRPGQRIGTFDLDLSANPAPADDWLPDEDPVRWAAHDARFDDFLAPAEGPGPNVRATLDRLERQEPAGAPVVKGREGATLRARPELLQFAAERLAVWRQLRHLENPAGFREDVSPEPIADPGPTPEEIDLLVRQQLRARLGDRLRALAKREGLA